MNEKFIPILAAVGHYMVFLNQSDWNNVGYLPWVIPGMIWVSREITNFVGVGYSCIAVET